MARLNVGVGVCGCVFMGLCVRVCGVGDLFGVCAGRVGVYVCQLGARGGAAVPAPLLAALVPWSLAPPSTLSS